ncbi:hypothetical protein FB45DRAFT_13641 [Roridomyces roridus]|uniref:Uncharacterized protein n=1 Tax=Roridomyces roridus TaxID=1738132 RepID=A0AAD7CIX4_9AGAR|nr:hypothetical protein FB45DRAFT_13641 [Roridomyces roridus]
MFKSTLFAAALVASVAAQQLTINTPTSPASKASNPPAFSSDLPACRRGRPVCCLPDHLEWWNPPYIVTVSPQTGGNPIVTFPGETGTTQTWVVNATSGESLIFAIRDANGVPASSGTFTVGAGTGDTSCLGAGGSTPPASSGGSAPASTPGSGSSPSSAGGSSPSSAGGSSPSSAGGSSPSSASKASSAPSGSSSVKSSTSPWRHCRRCCCLNTRSCTHEQELLSFSSIQQVSLP